VRAIAESFLVFDKSNRIKTPAYVIKQGVGNSPLTIKIIFSYNLMGAFTGFDIFTSIAKLSTA